ncbi:MAG: hypothetical protein Q9217_007038, partial [Psora testacea]
TEDLSTTPPFAHQQPSGAPSPESPPQPKPSSSSFSSPLLPPLSPVASSSLLLTSDHLNALNRSFRGGSEEASEEDSEDEESLAGSDISYSSMTLSAADMRSLLERNRMFIDNIQATEIGSALIAKAKSILEERRGSDWEKPKAEVAMADIADERKENERTFARNFWRVICNGERQVDQGELTEEGKTKIERWVTHDFKKDHLRARVERVFAADSLPGISPSGDAQWDKLLKKFHRVAKPEPDMSFSVYHTAFNERQIDLFRLTKSELAGSDAFHTFCIIEFKGLEKPIAEAENQCARAGAAMSKNLRFFNRAVQAQDLPAADPDAITSSTEPSTMSSTGVPDMDSFAFSIAITPDMAKTFVNWCLVKPGKILHWHMHHLRSYLLNDPDYISKLRHDINNILDWGIGKRKRKIEQLANEFLGSKRDLKLVDEAPSKKRKKEDNGSNT